MQFKVGDRVEAIEPPVGVEDSEADQVGPGELIAIDPKGYDGETHKVLLDSGDSWWYSEDRLRHPIVSKPTPTPSITVGTQVRLTGVVVKAWPEGGFEVCVDGAPDMRVNIKAKHLEVIRQPFKRGEVVYLKSNPTNEIPCRILEDEDATTKGQVLLVGEYYPTRTEYVDPTLYERRP